jgi:hypothetical protein
VSAVVVEGLRMQLDEFAKRTDANWVKLRDSLDARLAATKP